MNRRELMKGLAGLGAVVALPSFAFAEADPSDVYLRKGETLSNRTFKRHVVIHGPGNNTLKDCVFEKGADFDLQGAVGVEGNIFIGTGTYSFGQGVKGGYISNNIYA